MSEFTFLVKAVEPYLGAPGAFFLLVLAYVRLEVFLNRQKTAWSALKVELDAQGNVLALLSKRVEELVEAKTAVKIDLDLHRSKTQDELEAIRNRIAAIESHKALRR